MRAYPPGDRVAVWLVALMAGVVVALSIRFNTFVAWGTDPASYVESAHRWAEGRLVAPSPLQFAGAAWAADSALLTSMGFREGPVHGTNVSEYPLGFPVLMAAALRVGGDLAPYLVAPLAAGLLVAATYLIASALAGRWAGVLAAFLVGASPVTLAFAVQVMSDVPATALWVLAWAMSVRPGLGASVASGLAVALAVMVRPNLAPLAIVLFFLNAVEWTAREGRGGWSWRRTLAWTPAAALGPAMVLWSQAALYNSALTPGYSGAQTFFSTAHISTNLVMYPTWLVTVHTPLIFAGLLAPVLACRERRTGFADRRACAIAVSGVVLVAQNIAVYLAYLPLPDLIFVRFLLPALSALYVLLAAVTVWVGRRLASVSRLLAPLAFVPILVVAIYPAPFVRFAFGIHESQTHPMLMGHYLREALPENAVILTVLQAGAAMHYTGRPVMRFDRIPADGLNRVLDDLRSLGYRPVLLVDQGPEAFDFVKRFAPSSFDRLDWPPRAVFADRSGSLSLFDFADREAYRRGSRWPTDIVHVESSK